MDENLRDKCIIHPSIEDLDDIWMIYGRWMVMEVGGGWERHFKDGRLGGGGLYEAWWSI